MALGGSGEVAAPRLEGQGDPIAGVQGWDGPTRPSGGELAVAKAPGSETSLSNISLLHRRFGVNGAGLYISGRLEALGISCGHQQTIVMREMMIQVETNKQKLLSTISIPG